jgi:hypothetical protein
MDVNDLKTEFLRYLKNNNKPDLDEKQTKFLDFITQKIVDGKCRFNNMIIANADFQSSNFIAILLDAFMGYNMDITVIKIVRQFSEGKLPYGHGINLNNTHQVPSVSIF